MRSYSYSQVLHGHVPPAAFADKIVVVGTEALRLKDASTTSTTDGSLMSGPEVQGNAIATVLAGLPLRSPGGDRRHAADRAHGRARAAGGGIRPRRSPPWSSARSPASPGWPPPSVLFGAGLIVPVVHPLVALRGRACIGVLAAHARRATRPARCPERAQTQVAQARPLPTLADEIGGFRLEELIGRGGMGVVYRAEQPGLERKVAVKVIAPGHAADARFRERFAREARLAAALDHPNIVPVYTTGEDGGQLYLVMRYIDGVNLAERLRSGPLPLADVATIVGQVASALDAAHARGIVHRDVKPANILLVERDDAPPHAFLTDFGITRELGGTDGLTQAGAFLGSLDYAAPEQAAGAGAARRSVLARLRRLRVPDGPAAVRRPARRRDPVGARQRGAATAVRARRRSSPPRPTRPCCARSPRTPTGAGRRARASRSGWRARSSAVEIRRMDADAVSPLEPFRSTPEEIRERLVAERSGTAVPGAARRDRRAADRRPRAGRARGSRSGAARSATSRSSGTRRSPACTPSSSASGEEWVVVDDGLSSNGTHVCRERVVGRRRLQHGDLVRLGDTMVAFCAPGDGVEGTTLADDLRIAAASVTDAQRKVVVALCRPFKGGVTDAVPATNPQIAEELFLTVAAVKTHLRALFRTFGLEDLPQSEKRRKLVAAALASGLVHDNEL